MKNFLLLFSILFIICSCDKKQDAASQEDIENTILNLERQALDRWAAGDPLGFTVNFADEATYFDDIAAQTRIDGIEEMRVYLTSLEGKVPPHSYEIVDPKVQVFGDFAISTLHYLTVINGEPGPSWKATDVYRLINDEWRMVHAHWSLVKSS